MHAPMTRAPALVGLLWTTRVHRRPAGLRLGMYGPMKSALGADTDPTLARKVAAGSASGAVATFITNPIELLKTRLQSNSTQGPLAVVRSVVAKDGVTGLWKGTMPSAVRAPAAPLPPAPPAPCMLPPELLCAVKAGTLVAATLPCFGEEQVHLCQGARC